MSHGVEFLTLVYLHYILLSYVYIKCEVKTNDLSNLIFKLHPKISLTLLAIDCNPLKTTDIELL